MISYGISKKTEEGYTIEYKKITANEFAKWLVADKGETAHYWSESYDYEYERMTQKEVDAVNDAIEKQLCRVREFLGTSKIYNKIYG